MGGTKAVESVHGGRISHGCCQSGGRTGGILNHFVRLDSSANKKVDYASVKVSVNVKVSIIDDKSGRGCALDYL